jgi:hypothetical protein
MLDGMTASLTQQLSEAKLKLDSLNGKVDTMAPQIASTNTQVNTVYWVIAISGFSVSTLRVAHRNT